MNLKPFIAFMTGILLLALTACSTTVGQLSNTGQTTQTETAPTSGTGTDETPHPGPTGSETATIGTDRLAGTQWSLASITAVGTETSMPATPEVTLSFGENGQVTGSGGCNSFGAQYTIDGNTITFSQIISTKMACTDTSIMNLEQRFFQALQLSGTFEQTDEGLTISFDNGAGSLNFARVVSTATPSPIADKLCSGVSESDNPEWQRCRSEAYGFEIQFPAAGELTDNTADFARINLPISGTNLTEKYLQIDAQPNKTPCTSPLAEGNAPGTIPSETVTFNGLEFTKQTGQGAATDNRYDWTAYSITRNDTCLSLSFMLHSFEPELQPTPPPRYEQQAESAVFPQIMQTFAWLNPSATPTPVTTQSTPQRIDFATGATTATESGHLAAAGSDLYVLRALQGQTMTVDLSFSQGQAILVAYGADGTVLQTDHAEAAHFEGNLPSTQDYYIQVEGRPEGPTDYQMTVSVPPLGASWPTPTPQLIDFAPGAISATVSGSLPASGSDIYKPYALEGQTMRLDLSASQGQAILVVWGEDGTVLQTNHTEVTNLERQLPSSQYYFIQVEGYPDGPTDYRLQITIPPA